MKVFFAGVLVVCAFVSSASPIWGHPSAGLAVDGDGNVFFSDLSRGVLKVDPRGAVTTFSQEGGHWLRETREGAFRGVEFEKSAHWPRWFKRRTADGVKPALISDGGAPLVVARDGNLYYVCNDEQMVPGGMQIAQLTPEGKETLVSPGLHAIAEKMGGIKGLAEGPDGSLYVSYPKAILRVARDGAFTTVLDPVVTPDCEKTPASIHDAPALRGLAVDERGTVYAAATGCRCVIKITPDAKVATLLKAEAPWSPCGVVLVKEELYVLEHINANSEAHEDWPPRVRKMGRDGVVTTLITLGPEEKAVE